MTQKKDETSISPLFKNVRWLTIKEIADLWAPQLGIASSIVERRLQLVVINLPRWRKGEPLIDKHPPENELPSVTTVIDRQDIVDVCRKQGGWPRPDFWFEEIDDKGKSFPGRPSIMRAIVQELESLAKEGKLEDTLAAQAQKLEEWARHNCPGQQIARAPSIANGIRDDFRRLKAAAH